MKQYIEIKADTVKEENISLKTEITNEELKFIEPVINALANFKKYTTKDGWEHTHNFPLTPHKDKGEKSIKELYFLTEEQIGNFLKYCPKVDIHTITDVDIIYSA